MAENKENMGAVTHQVSNYDDDMQKAGHVKETNVASVALGKFVKFPNDPGHSTICWTTC
jgi:hypothetical protein